MLYLAMIGLGELWPILIVLLLLFGAKKLPELARAMGSSINMFKKGLSDDSKAAEIEAASQERLAEGRAAESAAGAGAGAREKEGSAQK